MSILLGLNSTVTSSQAAYTIGRGLLKTAGDAVSGHHLAGRLYASKSGWILLSVPNALLHGTFDSIHEPGAEKPGAPGAVNAHISVMTPEDVAKIGGIDKITERGKLFRYNIGPIKSVVPKTWKGIAKVWYITVTSPELRELRRSYGLSPQPQDDYDFHITFAIRRVGVLHENDTSKAAYSLLVPESLPCELT